MDESSIHRVDPTAIGSNRSSTSSDISIEVDGDVLNLSLLDPSNVQIPQAPHAPTTGLESNDLREESHSYDQNSIGVLVENRTDAPVPNQQLSSTGIDAPVQNAPAPDRVTYDQPAGGWKRAGKNAVLLGGVATGTAAAAVATAAALGAKLTSVPGLAVGAKVGAIIGGGFGSIVPGAGTAAGAAVGGVVGAVIGALVGAFVGAGVVGAAGSGIKTAWKGNETTLRTIGSLYQSFAQVNSRPAELAKTALRNLQRWETADPKPTDRQSRQRVLESAYVLRFALADVASSNARFSRDAAKLAEKYIAELDPGMTHRSRIQQRYNQARTEAPVLPTAPPTSGTNALLDTGDTRDPTGIHSSGTTQNRALVRGPDQVLAEIEERIHDAEQNQVGQRNRLQDNFMDQLLGELAIEESDEPSLLETGLGLSHQQIADQILQSVNQMSPDSGLDRSHINFGPTEDGVQKVRILKEDPPTMDMTVYFGRDDQGRISGLMHHARLGSQGDNIMKGFFQALLQLHEANPSFAKFSLTANLTVGGYAWMRSGFIPRDGAEFRKLARDEVLPTLRNYLELESPETEQRKQVESLIRDLEIECHQERPDRSFLRRIAALEIPISDPNRDRFLRRDPAHSSRNLAPDELRGRFTLGKACLLGTSWNGSFDFEQDKLYLKAYVASRLGLKARLATGKSAAEWKQLYNQITESGNPTGVASGGMQRE